MIEVQALTKVFGDLRGAFIGASHIGLAFDMSVLAVLAAVFLVLGAWVFSKIQV